MNTAFSKSQIKQINSLRIKKYRLQHGLFIVEGSKSVIELLQSNINVESIIISEQWRDKNQQSLNLLEKKQVVSHKDFQKISQQSNSDGILGVFHRKTLKPIVNLDKDRWYLLLDGIRDPGNMGTIIRTAHYFGLTEIICSKDTVDCYNQKTIQSSMASIADVDVHYTGLEVLLTNSNIPVYATTMNSMRISPEDKLTPGAVILGNEANGVSEKIIALSTKQWTIPGKGSAESLNVAIANGIILAELFS